MPKDLVSLEKSRKQREDILQYLGVIPESIMVNDKTNRALDMNAEERSQANYGYNGEMSHVRGFTISGRSVRDGKGLSRFPQNVGAVLLKLYTDEGDVVIDPFAGHNSRMELVWRHNRHYKGQDVSKEFMEANFKIKGELLAEKSFDLFPQDYKGTIELKIGDSRKLQYDDEIGDFTITSPPYWNIEYYGDEPEQLGNNDYIGFLYEITKVMRENYRVLKKGSFCCWFVNDFRKDGKFYNYHSHIIERMSSVGFVQHDIVIVDLGSSFRQAFAQQIVDTLIIPKRHEYCLVFKKE
jgi:DNA modification methylase